MKGAGMEASKPLWLAYSADLFFATAIPDGMPPCRPAAIMRTDHDRARRIGSGRLFSGHCSR